jgi:hypothetical protein
VDGAFLMLAEDVSISRWPRHRHITGSVRARGIVKVGEEIEIVEPADTQKTICTGVEMFRKPARPGPGWRTSVSAKTSVKMSSAPGAVQARLHQAPPTSPARLHLVQYGGSPHAILQQLPPLFTSARRADR